MYRFLFLSTTIGWFLFAGGSYELHSADWTIPLAGNIYRTKPGPGGGSFGRDGLVAIQDPHDVYSAYVYFDRPAKIALSIIGKTSGKSATLLIRAGNQEKQVSLGSKDIQSLSAGEFDVHGKGYMQFDMKLDGNDGVQLRELQIASMTDGLSLDFVRSNQGNMFYWGRRGPSVHLGYRFPDGLDVQYAYNEITVPLGEDPIGTYYMAIGFAEGYFGIQVNGPEERRVLFSIWSPFKTDNPRDIPADQRIEALAKGPGVHIGEFGNEGSGGQSYLVYPWQTGKTYRFLTEVAPDGVDKTTYTAWFSEKNSSEWQLVARFRRPKTQTHLKGFHSFLESFTPSHGYIGRQALYGNQWVCDLTGKWHECTEARFTVDETGGKRHRVDFAGGVKGNKFYLRNCGFFSETVQPGTMLQRGSTAADQPQIDFKSLPRE